MEQRRLILFGKSAYCITLPSVWLKKNRLKKGDILNVQESLRNSLEVFPTVSKSNDIDNLTIDISGKSNDEIVQILLATYLNGYSLITLEGNNSGKVATVRKNVHELIAAEIMEVTSHKIIIHVFWDINNINLYSMINRLETIIKSIFLETIELLDSKSDVNDISEKGQEVKRQVLLARRAIKYALNNSSAAQRFNLSSLELLYFSYIFYFLGNFSEYIRSTSKIIEEAKKDKAQLNGSKKEFLELLGVIYKYFDSVLTAYNRQEKRSKHYSANYLEVEKAIDAFTQKSARKVWTPILAEYLKLMIMKIKELQFIMISLENAPK